MPTYILIHRPPRKPYGSNVPQYPAREIVENIRMGMRAISKYGGWSIGKGSEENMKEIAAIEPGSRLLFYRSCVEPRGFFAVGRVLPADDPECRQRRMNMLRERHKGNPNAVNLGPTIGPAAYLAVDWERGKGKTIHVNTEWDIVTDPEDGMVLFPRLIDKIDLGGQKPRSGIRIPDDKVAEAVCEECKPKEPGVQLDSNPEWNVVDSKRGRVFIRRKLIGACVD